VTAVCEQDPERPSVRATRGDQHQTSAVTAQLRGTSADRLARLLVGDLDGIVLMAMRKESAHRYASADMLRQDIERYLAGLPVLAHRGGQRYRLRKFLRRHRAQAAAAAIVVAALVTGLSVAIVQERRASRERDRAEQALAESTGVTNFLVELFQVGDPGDLPPSQLSALDLLNRGALRAGDLSNQPIVHARLLDVIGQMSLHLGRLDEARARLEQAVAIRRASISASTSASTSAASLDLASSLIHLARVHRTRKDNDVAKTLVTEALEIRRAALPPNHPDIADALYELGWLDFSGRQENLYRQALATLPDTPATAERRVTWSLALSTNLRRQGRLEEAVAAARDALAVAERQFGREHHTTGYAMIHLADHVRDIEQDVATAERLYRGGLESTTRRFGDNSIRLLHGLNSLAELLGSRGDAEAETHLRRALAISRSSTGPEHLQVADELHRLAREIARQGRLTEAETLSRQALDGFIRTLGARHQDVKTRATLLADILDRQRRYQEADELYRTAFEENEYPANVVIGEMHRQYGRMLLRRGDRAGAEAQLLESLAVLGRGYGGANHPNVQETKRALMELYRQWGKPELVERYRVPPGRFIPY
jgi:eukaryotic-like serine/threonine-protein kinase